MLNNKFPDLKIQCFFDQTIGQNTSEILRKLPLYIKKNQPNLIIFMVGTNNWWNLNRSNILLFNKNKTISEFTLKTLVFLDKFRTWKLIKWIAHSMGLKQERWNYWAPQECQDNSDLCYKKLKENYNTRIFWQVGEYDLREMIKICKINNIKIIICNYPRTDIYFQRELAKKFSIPFVDNFGLFKSLPNAEEYLSDKYHPNDRGYKLVAENIYNCILENKLIE